MTEKFLLALIMVSTVAYSQSNVHLREFPMTSGTVSSIVTGDPYTVLRGNFNGVGTYQGNGAVIDATTGAHDPGWPVFHGNVYAVISDNNGGWYVTGTAEANGVLFQRLVHVKSDKTIDETWAPNPNSFIRGLALDGNTLYVGGNFTQIAGTPRNQLAAFDVTTGNLLPWNPDMPPGNRIEKLTVSGSIVYVGGQFTTVGGQSRKNIAAIDASTGVVTAWNPTVDGINSSVYDIEVSGSVVYVSGGFTSAGGLSRRSLAALDITTGNATTWNPNPNSGVVRTMELTGSTMYIGGSFTTVGGTLREYLAEVSTTTGVLTSWDPNFDDAIVYDAILSGTTLFVAGTFGTVNGETKQGLAAVSTTTGALLSWDPKPDVYVTDMALFGTTLFVEGSDDANFQFDWSPANDFVIIENATGELSLNDLDIGSGTISYAITNGNTVYISGDFTEVNGQSRTGLAAIDIPSGTVLSWAPVTDAQVSTLSVSGSTVFLGGNFSSVNGTPRTALAAVNATSGNLLSLNHNFNGGEIFSLFATGNILYAGGNFSSVNGSDRNNIAAITISTGNILLWNPADPDLVDLVKIQANSDWVVVKNVSNTVLVLDAGSANKVEEFNEELNDFALAGDILILGTTQEDFGDNGLAAFNLAEEEYTSWDPDVGSDSDGGPAVRSVGIVDDLIFVGGIFEGMGFENRQNFGVYNLTGTTPNQAPVISSTTTGVLVEGIVTIDLLDLISDPDDNLDLITLSVDTESAQGATAVLDDLTYILTLDYGNVQFIGTDEITVGICDLAGECVEQQLIIEVGGDVIVYNAVSPDGNGMNDILLIQYVDVLPNTSSNKVTIFNRWGDVVFEVSNYNNTDRAFNGKDDNGKNLPSGTYFYKIEFRSGRNAKTGFLSLKR